MDRQNREPLRALITNLQGFSTEDGPGIRTTIFFKGCPLRCPWCHNPEGLTAKPELIFYADKCIACKECVKVCPHQAPVPGGPGSEECELCFRCVEVCPAAARQKMGEWWTVEALLEKVLRDRVYYETSGGGVTASGGEAMIYAEFVAELFGRLRGEGVHTALDTSGVVGGAPLKKALERTDLALLDLKLMDPERHRRVIGVELEPILAHIREIDRSGTPIIVRVPLVPGHTDSADNLEAIARFARELDGLERIELLPYHRLGESKYRHLGKPYPLSELKPPSDQDMERAKSLLGKAGVKVTIAGKD